ncbi:class I SAM-dependent methyltransferase [Leifsonia sp. NPDC058230]|uniref:class I SAM-dependent methyltransferase n=1 Tax=Leifsonia sp. NPDC058230 TaxID=3346391 RepID=UPI0036DF9694
MAGEDEDGWSSVAGEWAELWGGFADPARRAVIAATGIGSGFRVLDIGCGSGELLAMLDRLGVAAAGIDPAPGMVALARTKAPRADVRLGSAESLPWPDGGFDVACAFNALQFAEDTLDAVAEAVRVTKPGGLIAVCNWAERSHNDIDTIEAAVAAAHGDEPIPDGDLRPAGGLESLLAEAGLEVVAAELVEVLWTAPDDDTLVRGVLLGEDAAGQAAGAPTVLEAATPFRVAGGGYRLSNAFRFAVARTPA